MVLRANADMAQSCCQVPGLRRAVGADRQHESVQPTDRGKTTITATCDTSRINQARIHTRLDPSLQMNSRRCHIRYKEYTSPCPHANNLHKGHGTAPEPEVEDGAHAVLRRRVPDS